MKYLKKILNIFNKLYFLIINVNCKISMTLKLYNDGFFILGKNISIEKDCTFRIGKKAKIIFQDNVFIGKDVEMNSNSEIYIGENTSIQSRANIFGDVRISSNCVIGPNLYVSSFSHEFFKFKSKLIIEQDKFPKKSKKVTINEDCFIGINVFIKPGVTIGRGCIIGANTNVIKDLEPYSVVVGNPAKFLKKRIDLAKIDEIQNNNHLHFPYFYRGFKENTTIKELCVNEKNFCININAYDKKKIILEIYSEFSSYLTFSNLDKKKFFSNGSSVIEFEINDIKNDLLEFELNQFPKNKIFIIKSIKSE